MTDLSELIARVEKATGPDREIDWLVLQQCGWRRETREYDVDTVICRAEVVVKPDGTTYDWRHETFPEPTASLDAVIALVEREMPDAYIEIRKIGNRWLGGIVIAATAEDGFSDQRRFYEWAPTPALALLLAFLTAHEQEGT